MGSVRITTALQVLQTATLLPVSETTKYFHTAIMLKLFADTSFTLMVNA